MNTLSISSNSVLLRCWAILLISHFITPGLFGQTYETLTPLKGHLTQVYYSKGAEAKAKRMADQLDGVIKFYSSQIHFTPRVDVLILSPQDWSTYTKFPVYGMPHYIRQTLIIASEDNDFWKGFIPPLDKLPKSDVQRISEVYSDKKGGLSMEPFFDLLAIHELGHAYHKQDSLIMQRQWMAELFTNIMLHGYIAENEPHLLPALTVFPKMVVTSVDTSMLKFTSLEDLELHYSEIAQKYPRNYGWYQCRWHMAAVNIYDQAGIAAFKKLWSVLKEQRGILDNREFSALLSEKVDKSVADVPLRWDK